MPNLKGPETLFDLSKNVVVEFLTVPFRGKGILNYDNAGIINSVISCIPGMIVDNIVLRVIEAYSQLKKRVEDDDEEENTIELPPAYLLLKAVIVPQLQTLDCRSLVRLGYVSDTERANFQCTLTLLIPSLRNLVRLSFSTHKNEFTLPVCDDEVLKAVGDSCPLLKCLNFRCCNHVTDDGLKCLVPELNAGGGCALLEELYCCDSSVTSNGITLVLEYLRSLRIVDFKELCTSLIQLYNKCLHMGSPILNEGLKITHINNLGVVRPAQKLQFDKKAVKVVRGLCPSVENIKVRVTDFDVANLRDFPSLTSVEFMYNIGRPISPGEGTECFLTHFGRRLTSVTFICNLFPVELFTAIGENCPNLEQLWIKCNELLYTPDWTEPASQLLIYTNLQKLYIRIGESDESENYMPAEILTYMLKHSYSLRVLQLIFKSKSMTDTWFDSVLLDIPTSSLEKVFIAIPGSNATPGLLNLSMKTVDSIMLHCANLRMLGNLLVWNISRPQVTELKEQIAATNLDLTIIHRFMKIK